MGDRMNRRELLRGSAMIGIAAAANPKVGTWPSKPCVRLWCECSPEPPFDAIGQPTVAECAKFQRSKGRRVIHTFRGVESFGAVIAEIACSSGSEAIVLADEILRIAGTDEGHAEYGYLVEIAAYAGD